MRKNTKKDATQTHMEPKVHSESIRNQSKTRCRKMDVQKSINRIRRSSPYSCLLGIQLMESSWLATVPEGRILGAILSSESVKIDAQIDVERILKMMTKWSRNYKTIDAKSMENHWNFEQIPAPTNTCFLQRVYCENERSIPKQCNIDATSMQPKKTRLTWSNKHQQLCNMVPKWNQHPSTIH